ncbi:type II secretion system minor pseudopilin GspI [Aquabacterium sp.]|uniref:type II secretion system minor pseudopilin GspI n=1 Tax=Aquabacterium sp. TaxID=1872578 RepID=UPI0040377922
MRRLADQAVRGMTLIEVLVALAIVAITLSAGIKAAGGLTLNAQRMSDLTLAQWCAENQITSLKLAKIYPPVGDSDFSCQQLGRTFPGHMTVRPTPNLNFRRVDAQVMDEERQPIVKLSTVLPRF